MKVPLNREGFFAPFSRDTRDKRS